MARKQWPLAFNYRSLTRDHRCCTDEGRPTIGRGWPVLPAVDREALTADRGQRARACVTPNILETTAWRSLSYTTSTALSALLQCS